MDRCQKPLGIARTSEASQLLNLEGLPIDKPASSQLVEMLVAKNVTATVPFAIASGLSKTKDAQVKGE